MSLYSLRRKKKTRRENYSWKANLWNFQWKMLAQPSWGWKQWHAYLWKYTSKGNIAQLLQMLYPINLEASKTIYFSVTDYIMAGNHRLCKTFLKSFKVPQMIWVLNEGKTFSNLNLRFFWIDYFSLKKLTCENDGVMPSSLPLYI